MKYVLLGVLIWFLVSLAITLVIAYVRGRKPKHNRIDFLSLVADIKRGLPDAPGRLGWHINIGTSSFRYKGKRSDECSMCLITNPHSHNLPAIKVELWDLIANEIVEEFTQHCYTPVLKGNVGYYVPRDHAEIWADAVDRASIMNALIKEQLL